MVPAPCLPPLPCLPRLHGPAEVAHPVYSEPRFRSPQQQWLWWQQGQGRARQLPGASTTSGQAWSQGGLGVPRVCRDCRLVAVVMASQP